MLLKLYKGFVRWLMAPCEVYVLAKMTGENCRVMRRKAMKATHALEKFGLIVHHPVIDEGVPDEDKVLTPRSQKELLWLWLRDKAMIKQSHAFLDTAADVFSVGAKREFGKARFRDWKPIVTLWEHGEWPLIAEEEDDQIVATVEEAAALIEKMWGTRWKRILWRIPIYLSHPLDISPRKLWQFWR